MKFLGVGDNVIDYYENTKEMYPGGNAVNVAVHASKLGAESAYLGNLGDDDMSNVIRRALQRFHVELDHCVTITGGTTKYCNYTVTDGERRFCSVELGSNWSGPMELGEKELTYAGGFDVLHSCCNAKMEDEMKKLSSLPGIFVYDFGEKEKYRVDEYLEKICPGLDLALFSCPSMTEEEARRFCEDMHKRGVVHVLVTMGAAGQYVSNGSSLVYGEAKYIQPVDTMGAGDSFLAAFVTALYEMGWKKGKIMSEEVLLEALHRGRDYSTENCQVEGSFGYKELIR